MFARLALLLLAVPTLALAQGAPAPSTTAPKPAAAGASQTPAPPVQPQLVSYPPPPPADPAQCRMGCAQASYACRASDQPQGCDGTWSQCVATCDLPDMASDVSTAP